MTLDEAINYALVEATGKVRDISDGDPKYMKLKKIANLMLNQWENELGVEWQSKRQMAYLGDVDLVETVYRMPKQALKLARKNNAKIIIKKGDQKWELPVEAPLFTGWSLDFDGLFKEGMAGGEIFVPITRKCEELTNPEQIVEIDNPYWLVFMMAAEFARNDLLKSGQYGNLVAYAQGLMATMKMNNEEAYSHEIDFMNYGGVFND